MDEPRAFRSASLTSESRNDSGYSLATTAALSDPEDEPIVHRRINYPPKDAPTKCVPPTESSKPKTRKGWGGFLGNIFRSASPTSSYNSGISVDPSAPAAENDRQVPSPIGDIGYFAHPNDDDDDEDTKRGTSGELVPAPPAPPRRVVSDAPFRASTGTSGGGRKSSLLSDSSKMTRRHSMSDSNLCRLRGRGRMSTSTIIGNVQSDKKSGKGPLKAGNDMLTTSTSSISTTKPTKGQQRRRSSLKAQTGPPRRPVARSASMPSLQRSVAFNKSVGFAIIPSIDELSGSMRRKLYTSESEYNAISHRRDTEIVILRARALSPFRPIEDTNRDRQNNENESDEEDSHACDWGIEHHLLAPAERHARASKIRKTIDAVLGEQDKQRELSRQRGIDYNAYDAIGISTVSMRHSQTARIMALERARNVERECKMSMMRRKSDSVLEVANLKSSWSCSDSESDDEYCCASPRDGNAYHLQGKGRARPVMGKKSKSMKTSSKMAKMKRRMSLGH